MDSKDAENTQTATATPAPSTETPASVPISASVSAPVESPAAKQDAKFTAAFIKQRQEIRDLKQKLAAAPASSVPPATPATEQPKPITAQPTPAPVPAPTAIAIVDDSAAIAELGKDKDLSAIPGSIVELVNMVDSDPVLSKIRDASPEIAYKQAKGLLLEKYGIAPTPPIPKSTTPSGGMVGGGNANLEALLSEIEAATPGTRKYAELVSKFNTEMKKKLG